MEVHSEEHESIIGFLIVCVAILIQTGNENVLIDGGKKQNSFTYWEILKSKPLNLLIININHRIVTLSLYTRGNPITLSIKFSEQLI